MKKHLLVLFALPAWLSMAAQTGPQARQSAKPAATMSRWSIDFTAGPAIPVGHFAGIHNTEFPTHGAVAKGGIAEAAVTYRIWRSISAILAFDGQLNHGNGIPQTTVYSYLAGQAPHAGAFGDYWQIARVLGGAVYTLPLAKHSGSSVLVRAMAGIQHTRIPDFDETDPVELPGYHYVFHAQSPEGWPGMTFSYEFDGGLQWKLHGRWSALAYAAYNGARLVKKQVISDIPGPNSQAPVPSGFGSKSVIPLNTLSFRAGVTLGL